MSPRVTLCLVLLAAYGLIAALLSGLVAVAWRVGLARVLATADEVLALRLLPSAGAGLVTLGVVLPAFLLNEPAHDSEQLGWLLAALALFALAMLADGIRRGCHAWWEARTLSRRCNPVDRYVAEDGRQVDIVDVAEPIVAVLGAWRPRIVAARRVVTACSVTEFRQVVSHEFAHVSARDNLKLLSLVVSPDPLGWLPTGAALTKHWRAVAELEADERATGPDTRKRVALAGALIKVARLALGSAPPLPALTMPVVGDGVEGRVRQLLLPPAPVARGAAARGLLAFALPVPALAVPFYASIHHWIEALVVCGS